MECTIANKKNKLYVERAQRTLRRINQLCQGKRCLRGGIPAHSAKGYESFLVDQRASVIAGGGSTHANMKAWRHAYELLR